MLNKIKYYLSILIIFFVLNCTTFKEGYGNVQSIYIVNQDVTIEAIDKSFKFKFGKNTPPSSLVKNSFARGNYCAVNISTFLEALVLLPLTLIDHSICLFGGWDFAIEGKYYIAPPRFASPLTSYETVNEMIKKGAKKVKVTIKDKSYNGALIVFPIAEPYSNYDPEKFNFSIDISHLNPTEFKNGGFIAFFDGLSSYERSNWVLWLTDVPF